MMNLTTTSANKADYSKEMESRKFENPATNTSMMLYGEMTDNSNKISRHRTFP